MSLFAAERAVGLTAAAASSSSSSSRILLCSCSALSSAKAGIGRQPRSQTRALKYRGRRRGLDKPSVGGIRAQSDEKQDRAEERIGDNDAVDAVSQGAQSRRDESEWLADKGLAEIASSPLFYITAGAVAGVFLVRTFQGPLTVVVLAAVPFVGLTLYSKSSAGKKLQDDLEAKLPELREVGRSVSGSQQAQRTASITNRARSELPYFGEGRVTWLGPFHSLFNIPVPEHLNGDRPGDAGFDPLNLFNIEKTWLGFSWKDWVASAEVLHGRWAMLGVVGALIPEAFGLGIWWKVGAAKASGEDLNYLGIPGLQIAGAQGILIIALAQFLLMVGPEYARFVGIRALEPVGIFLPGENIDYPGGTPFDPLQLGGPFSEDDIDKAISYEKYRVAEIKHGRVSMIAFLGMAIQAAVTGDGPLRNLEQALDQLVQK